MIARHGCPAPWLPDGCPLSEGPLQCSRDPRSGAHGVEPDGAGGWRRRPGRTVDGALTEAQAAARMLELVRDHDAEQNPLEADAEERR
jgi:hypothetical protein